MCMLYNKSCIEKGKSWKIPSAKHSNHAHRQETKNTVPYMVVGSGIHKEEKFRPASSETNTKTIGSGETQQLGNVIFKAKM
jgi:hypothetical protein